MHVIWVILGWIFGLLFGLLTVSMLLMQNWLEAFALLIVVLLCLPPVTALLGSQFDFSLPPLLRGGLIIGFVVLFGWLLSGGGKDVTSLYKTPEAKARLMEIYDEKMTEWPVPYEDIFLETSYGTVHVIASGDPADTPMLLLHASGVAGWSWKFNAAGLSEKYRIYAIDLIGDVGKSEFASLDHTLQTDKDQADLYREISEQLSVPQAYVVGASDGGFIASNYARFYPERVEKLALLGPMGYAGADKATMRIMFATFFPLRPIQENTFSWAFSDSPVLEEEFGEWFRLLMNSYNPTARVRPGTFTPAERQELTVPTLFIFGERDNLVGDPAAATALVEDMPDTRVEVVSAGHLMGGELPEEVNGLVLDFFAE